MDETLKAYAGKRRQEAGPPFDLHPATRQMLQGEVARTYKQPPQSSWLRRIIVLWPRVAFAAACVAITITLVLVTLPRQRVMEMAQVPPAAEPMRDLRLSDKEDATKLRDGFADAPALPPASSTAPVTANRSLDRLAKQPESDELKAKSELMAEQRKDADSLKLLREEVAKNEVARRTSYANNAESVRTRYAQKAAEAQLGVRLQGAKQQQSVLDNFELEQVGDTVRVIDGDGSVYVGNILSADDVKKRSFSLQTGAVGGAAQTGTAENQLPFYAVGTNLSLRQKVSIEANILQLETNVVITTTPAPSQKPAAVNERSAGQYYRQTATQNAIRGRARVGTNQEVPIDAISIKP